jgi:hypothetical protein
MMRKAVDFVHRLPFHVSFVLPIHGRWFSVHEGHGDSSGPRARDVLHANSPARRLTSAEKGLLSTEKFGAELLREMHRPGITIVFHGYPMDVALLPHLFSKNGLDAIDSPSLAGTVPSTVE